MIKFTMSNFKVFAYKPSFCVPTLWAASLENVSLACFSVTSFITPNVSFAPHRSVAVVDAVAVVATVPIQRTKTASEIQQRLLWFKDLLRTFVQEVSLVENEDNVAVAHKLPLRRTLSSSFAGKNSSVLKEPFICSKHVNVEARLEQ